MTIYWKRGDTPLPLNAGPMDLTDCTVTVRIRRRDAAAETVYDLPATVLPGVRGDLTVRADNIPAGSWFIEAKASKGANFVATFPSGEQKQELYVSDDLRGGASLP